MFSYVGGTLIIALQNFVMYSILFELPQVAGRLFPVRPQDVGTTLRARGALRA